MANGLNVSNVVNITVNLSPVGASSKNFGIIAIFGDSDVITLSERYRRYAGIDEVAADFGVSAEEYKAAAAYFGQTPAPSECIIARWARTATPAVLRGAILNSTEQTLSNWTSIEDGGFKYTINGTNYTAASINLSTVTNMNGVATAITTAITSHGATCSWDGERFIIQTSGTGDTQSLGYLSAPDTGTDLSAKVKLSASTAVSIADGTTAELPAAAVAALDDLMGDFYFVTFAPSVALTDAENLAVADYIEASGNNAHIYGITATDTTVIDPTVTTDIASKCKAAKYNRTVVQYSSANTHAVNSLFGRAATVDFNGAMTTITLKFKQEPGITYEQISQSKAAALASKNANVFVYYNNDTAIIQEGVVASGEFIDTIHNLDWLSNALQTELYNVLYTSPTKIPQTDDGVGILVAAAKRVLNQGVNNGMIRNNAQWQLGTIGTLTYGSLMPTGYYVYAPAVNEQTITEREQRRVTLSIAVALAGAIHFVNAIINVQK